MEQIRKDTVMARRRMNKKNRARKMKKANSKKAKKQESGHIGLKELREMKNNLNFEIKKYINELGEADHFMFNQTTPEGMSEAMSKMNSAARNLHFQTQLCDMVDPIFGDLMAFEIEIAAKDFKDHLVALDHGEEKKTLYKKFHQSLLERGKLTRSTMKKFGIGLGLYEKIFKIRKITINGAEVLPFILDFVLPEEFKQRLKEQSKTVELIANNG